MLHYLKSVDRRSNAWRCKLRWADCMVCILSLSGWSKGPRHRQTSSQARKRFADAEVEHCIGATICAVLNAWQCLSLLVRSLILMDTFTLLWPVHSITSCMLIHSRLIEPACGYCTQGMIVIRLVPSDAWKFAHSCYSCAKGVASHWTPGIPTCVSLGTRWLQV